MQSAPATSRAPATNHIQPPEPPRRATIPLGRCGNPRSHQTQYPRFHEIAHSLGVGYKQYGRQRAEVLVDTVTYVVLAGQVGLDVGGESIPYVAGWGEAGELDAIREYAETIDEIARRIENAILPAAAAVPIDQPRELECAA